MTTTPVRARVLAPATLFLCAALVAFGCSPKKDEVTITTDTTATGMTPAPDTTLAAPAPPQNTTPTTPATPPDHVQVVHVLIAFDGSIPNQPIGRTKAAAEELAVDVLARARRGENFDQLMVKYSNDAAPGILYRLANTGVTPAQGEYARNKMVKGFGDVAFSLSPGNIGITEHDPQTSPFGWHIIKRIQ